MASFLAEVKLRNFKSQNILCAEAELQIVVYALCGSGNAEFQVTVYSLRGGGTSELQATDYSVCGGRTAELQVKALVRKRNCGTSSRSMFLVWKRNFQATVYSFCGIV